MKLKLRKKLKLKPPIFDFFQIFFCSKQKIAKHDKTQEKTQNSSRKLENSKTQNFGLLGFMIEVPQDGA